MSVATRMFRLSLPLMVGIAFGCGGTTDSTKDAPVADSTKIAPPATAGPAPTAAGAPAPAGAPAAAVTPGAAPATAAPAAAVPPPPPPPPPIEIREFSIPEGTKLAARLESAVASDTSKVEDRVEATLTKALTLQGVDVLPVGTVLKGVVSHVAASAKVKGLASIALKFTEIAVPGRDETYKIGTVFSRTAESTKKKDAKKVGIGAGAGAVIGAIAGGGKGAAIGTAVGGGVGAGAVMATKGDEVRLDHGTVMTLALDRVVTAHIEIKK